MKSKKALFNDLGLYFGDNEFLKGLNAKGVSNETYGRKSCIYFNARDKETRRNLEAFLAIKGYKVNRDYDRDGALIEVQVSYFKGERWWE